MSERKTTQGRLQGASPNGDGLSQAEPSGLGPPDFDPSREAWPDFSADEIVRRVRCLADDEPDEGDSPAQIWRRACDMILLRMGKHPSQGAAAWPRRPVPGLSEQGYKMAYDIQWLRDWRERTGLTLHKAMAAHDALLRASDERRDGRDDDSRLGAKPASAVDGADSDGEAPDLELSGLEVTEAICLDKLKRENAELREAYRATLHAARPLLRSARANLDGQTEQAEALYDAVERMDDIVGSHPFARTLLSQSTEGVET